MQSSCSTDTCTPVTAPRMQQKAVAGAWVLTGWFQGKLLVIFQAECVSAHQFQYGPPNFHILVTWTSSVSRASFRIGWGWDGWKLFTTSGHLWQCGVVEEVITAWKVGDAGFIGLTRTTVTVALPVCKTSAQTPASLHDGCWAFHVLGGSTAEIGKWKGCSRMG